MGKNAASYFKRAWMVGLLGGCIVVGCAHSGPNVHFRSIPSGVEVVDMGNNKLLGMTPVDGEWGGKKKKPKLVTVRFQKIGYIDRIETFSDQGKQITIEVEMEREEQ